MTKKTGTFKWFLMAIVLIAVMVGYYFWTREEKTEVPKFSSSGKGLVTGIVSGDKPSAVINGKIVGEGDMVNGIRIIKIYKDKVEFEKEGKRWRQRVKEKPPSVWDKAD